MARLARLSVPGQLHLLIQRVHQGLSVFADPADRRAYLLCLAEAAAKHGVAIHGYGLTPAEVRLLATPPDAQALGRMIQFIGRRFVAGFNRRCGRAGALWEGRFRATVVEPFEYFLPCLRYVEGTAEIRSREPVAEEVPWSSVEHHAGLRTDLFVTEHAQFWSLGNTPFEREAAYRSSAQKPMARSETEGIAIASLHGWVLGSEEFVRFLAARLKRRLRPLSPGRPPLRKGKLPSEISDPN
jgi:putative transposase